MNYVSLAAFLDHWDGVRMITLELLSPEVCCAGGGARCRESPTTIGMHTRQA